MKKHQVIFKPYNQDQLNILPPSLEELIPKNHLVRAVDKIVEKMKIDPLLDKYKGGGTSSYHPKMLLKVVIYAYTEKIYSSRAISKSIRENIHYMWLSGGNRPDFRTINRFRSSRLKGVIEKVFTSLISILTEEGYLKLEHYFLDGTKIEANANKYSWVWKKSTERYKMSLEKKIKELLKDIERKNDQENQEYGDRDLEELGEESNLTEDKLDEAVKKIDELLKKEPKDKGLKKSRMILQGDYIPRYKNYKTQEENLGDRNSYSKTDIDATFMRMKDDHMNNGQLKPAYNVQMGTENQFILGWSIHQKLADTSLLIPHIEKIKQMIKKLPPRIIADAGYGSQENYEYLEKEGKEAFVKYNNFYIQQRRNYKTNKYIREHLRYNKENDEFMCPEGKKLKYIKTKSYKTDNGYQTERRIYESEDCGGCPVKEQCNKSRYNRRIYYSPRLEKLQEKAREKLLSEEGIKLRGKRSVDVESVFGQIKQNMGFRRFLLRGLENVNIEYGLLAFAHNLKKVSNLRLAS